MARISFAMTVLALTALVPLGLAVADDEKKGDEKKVEKKIEVKALQLDGKSDSKPNLKIIVTDSDEKSGVKPTYLGVAVEPVPPALVAQLPGLVSKEQGLLVTDVGADSPAAKAGLKQHDVLVMYDDQKLFSIEQLTKLVRADKPGREVTLSVIRAGKLEKVKATIGEHVPKTGLRVITDGGDFDARLKDFVRELPGRGSVQREEFRKRFFDEKAAPGAKADVRAKSSFSSMRLESLDGDRFKAEIEFKNEKGDKLKRSFEGTRDEIRKQIEADKEMPEAIRNQLMHSLDFGKGGRPGAFRFNTPDGAAAFGFSIDGDDFPAFTFPAAKNLEQIIEQHSGNLDAETREKLKGALRSIEQPRKPTVPDRPR